MYVIDSSLRDKIYNGGVLYTPIVTIGNTIIPNNNIEYINVDNPFLDKTSQIFSLGSFVSTQIEIKLHNAINIDFSEQINLSVNIEEESSGDITNVPIGIFNIETNPTDYYKTCKIVALDNAVKLKEAIDIKQFFDTTTNDISVLELLQAICNYYGITLASYPNTNKNKRTAFYDNSISAKQYVSWCAEIMGSNAKIGRDGYLYIIPIKQTPIATIDALKGKSFTYTENYIIDKVVFDNGKVNPSIYPSEDTTHNTLFIRNNNIFVNGTDSERNEIIENIYTDVNGTSIASLKVENKADISLDSYDFVTYSVDNDTYNTFYNISYSLRGSIMGTNETNIPTKNQEQTTNVVAGTEKQIINSIRTTINQLDASLTTEITKTQNLQNQVDSQYEQIVTKINSMPDNTVINELRTQMTSIQTDTYTKNEINAIIRGTDESGNVVEYVKSGSATFDINGLTIDDSESKVKSTHSSDGLEVIDKTDNTELLFAGFDNNIQETVVRSKNIKVEKYFELGTNSRFEDYTDDNGNFGTGCFWVGE